MHLAVGVAHSCCHLTLSAITTTVNHGRKARNDQGPWPRQFIFDQQVRDRYGFRIWINLLQSKSVSSLPVELFKDMCSNLINN